MKKCPECGRFMEYDGDNEFHYICNHCDMFYCFEEGCYCCDEGEEVEIIKPKHDDTNNI
jgi:hypothetical protein